MRLLILSEEIDDQQRFGKVPYSPPFDVDLEVGDLNAVDNFHFSVFDHDVSIIIINESRHHSIGYFKNLPKLLCDSRIALENYRTIICLPKSSNYRLKKVNDYGMRVYDWLNELGILLQDNNGVDIKASDAGRAQVVQDYLKYSPHYHQIVVAYSFPLSTRLAVVDDTNIVVGLEQRFKNGTLVILPPPVLDANSYILAMSSLVNLARWYYEKAQRRIAVNDAPDWLGKYFVQRVGELEKQFRMLTDEKSDLDRIAYVLYGTGEELEASVAFLLQKLGLIVDPQPPGANIDIKAHYQKYGLGFAVEVTGTKSTIQKDSKKIAQAWQYLSERVGTPEEQDRLIIVANTQCHLSPDLRRDDSFSVNVVKLLADKGVLLMTTPQMYDLWKSTYDGKLQAEDVIRNIHCKSGIYS